MIKKLVIGNTLDNGAIIISVFGEKDWEKNCGFRYVLAINKHQIANEYASWLVDAQGNTTLGHYWSEFIGAVEDFKERIKDCTEVLADNL